MPTFNITRVITKIPIVSQSYPVLKIALSGRLIVVDPLGPRSLLAFIFTANIDVHDSGIRLLSTSNNLNV